MSATVLHPQSTLFRVLAEHLGFFPDLSHVIVHRGDREVAAELQVSAREFLGEAGAAPAVLMWAKTLAGPRVYLRRHDEEGHRTEVRVRGGIDDLIVDVWAIEDGELHRLVDPTKWATEISLDQLAQYVATGVLEAV
ncbi:hypothetical protein [Amycolatopsis thermoflava]|uniref:hypothetical protein n=1 Tax=Amycolatopsis thermoflava TaxID=84480 RepID=UPI000413E39E|nr:hypothetical protein [Amycolatopsis thermoflava]